MKLTRRHRRRSGGLASLEAVLATGVTIPIAAALVIAGLRLCRDYYTLLSTLVCWPYP